MIMPKANITITAAVAIEGDKDPADGEFQPLTVKFSELPTRIQRPLYEEVKKQAKQAIEDR